MRREYFTSHKKLPTALILILLVSNSWAKKESKDIEIICFAAQNKWICAPENQQNIASEKAANLLKQHESELQETEVVIKSINIPKFSSKQVVQAANNKTVAVNNNDNPASNQEIESNTKTTKPNDNSKSHLVKSVNDNPYAKLWSHQLIGVSTHQNAINFVKQKQLNKEDVLIIKSVRKNMDWWIVLFGLYKDKQTGLDNEKSLPANIHDAWLRPLKNLDVKGFIEQY